MITSLRRYGRGRLRGISLTVLVGMAFGLLLTLSMSLVLGLAVFANARNTFSLLNDKAILSTNALERQLRDHLDLASSAVVHLKTMLDGTPVGPSEQERLRPVLLAAMNANPAIDVLVVSDVSHREFGVYRSSSDKLWPFQRDDLPEVAQRYILPKVSATSAATWGPLITSGEVTYANVTVPIVENGTLTGYLTAAVSLEELGRTVAQLDDGPASTVFIIANGDEVIAHSDLDRLPDFEGAVARLPASVSSIGDPVLAAFDATPTLDNFKKANAAGIQVREFDVSGGPEYLSITKVIAGYGPGVWTVGQYFEASTISREIRRLVGSASVGLASIIVALGFAILLARRTARPLAEIARRAGFVGKLDFDSVQPLPRSRIRELDQVYQSFNAMVVGLKAMNIYVPRSLFSKLMRLGVHQATASEHDVTLVFTDIVGFTSLSENLSAAETAALLNAHFALLVAAVEREAGTVDKFIGDGMLAFWGAPDARADHAPAALRACLRIAEAMKAANREAERQGRPAFKVRIGLHSGRVVVGNVGALDRWNYTVVGDAVNLCERLQSLGREVAPEEETVILASDAAMSMVAVDGVSARAQAVRPDAPAPLGVPIGSHRLRGRSGSVTVWQVETSTDPASVGLFDETVEHLGRSA